MTEYEIIDVADLPPSRKAQDGTSFAAHLRSLSLGKALFVPSPEGVTLQRMTIRASASINSVAHHRHLKGHTRQDAAKNGVWVWFTQSENGAKP